MSPSPLADSIPTTEHLAARPLPTHQHGDKDDRGQVLVVAGSDRTPGAALLAGTAAVRVGAGKLQIATAPDNRTAIGIHVPESMAIDFSDLSALTNAATRADAVVVGPGLLDDDASLVRAVATALIDEQSEAVLVVDAGALRCLPERLPARTILMPNVDEAEELGVEGTGRDAAVEAARRHGAVVAIRGAETWIADPDGTAFCDDAGNVGLAVSGSGDVLSGMVGGLAARGADPLTAVLWAVHVHGVAGERLAERVAPIGFLARELLDVVPGLLAELSAG
jgi:ADP-dependent NAD(P)H-hydrate dehydratase